jgi:predicted lipoprotein with Yx(FWY)xxD motif
LYTSHPHSSSRHAGRTHADTGGTHADTGGTHAHTGGTHAHTGGTHAHTGGTHAHTTSTSGAKARARGVTVALRRTRLGLVLVGPSGLTLYMFTRDRGGVSSCYGGCASIWPALVSSGTPRAGPGVRSSLLHSTRRRGGALQVSYAGHPLYYYAGDGTPGQTSGEGLDQFGGLWWALSSSGEAVKRKPA